MNLFLFLLYINFFLLCINYISGKSSGDPSSNPGLALVALSRTKKLNDMNSILFSIPRKKTEIHMLLVPFIEKRLTMIPLSTSFQLKQKEISVRISKLAIETKKKFAEIWNNLPDDPVEIEMKDAMENEVLKPSFINAREIKEYNTIEEKWEYYLQPLDTWVKLKELDKYKSSIDCIKKVKKDQVLIKWYRQPVQKKDNDEIINSPPKKRSRFLL